MHMEIAKVLFLVAATASCTGLATTAFAQDTDPECNVRSWATYNPMPGHPTAQEREAFMERIVPLAKAAEAKYGVPAAALAAMSMNESGYGWTRTALNANNLFGFKYTDTAAKAGFSKYVLPCQPASDPNNAYIKFPNYAAAFDTLTKRFTTVGFYGPPTKAYAATTPKTREAVRAWLKAIAPHYNCCPATYIPTIARLMNNPLQPSNTEAQIVCTTCRSEFRSSDSRLDGHASHLDENLL
jgi:hypothetical protein